MGIGQERRLLCEKGTTNSAGFIERDYEILNWEYLNNVKSYSCNIGMWKL